MQNKDDSCIEFVSGLKVFSYRLAVRHRGQACLPRTMQVAAGLRGLASHSGPSCGHKATAGKPVSTRYTQQHSQTRYVLCNGRPGRERKRGRGGKELKEETSKCNSHQISIDVNEIIVTFKKKKKKHILYGSLGQGYIVFVVSHVKTRLDSSDQSFIRISPY